jgi:hypothetical protein
MSTDWSSLTSAIAARDTAQAAIDGIARAAIERAETAERDAAKWEATANTWRAFAVDVASVTGACDPDDVGIEDLRGLAGAVERLRAFALEVALQVAPLGEEQRAAQTTVRDLPAVTEALREVVAERDRADQRADRAHAYKVVAENEAAALRARAEALQVFAGSVALALTGAGAAADDLPDLLDVLGVALDDRASLRAEVEYQRARAEAAEAALATARAEGAAAERAAVLAELRDDLLGCEVLPERTENYARELIEEIAAGRHVRPVEGA